MEDPLPNDFEVNYEWLEPQKPLFTTKSAAEVVGITHRQMRKFCAQGRIGFKIGGRWFIEPKALEEFNSTPRKIGFPKGSKRIGMRGKIDRSESPDEGVRQDSEADS